MDIKTILNRWSFRRKLLLLLLIIFLPAFGIILADGFDHRKEGIIKAQNQALFLTQTLAAQQEQIAIATKTMLSTLAQLHEVQNLDASACNRIFHDLHQRYPFYSSILAMNPEGWVIGAHYQLGPHTVNQSDRKYFQDAVSSLDFSAGEYIIGRVSKMTSLNYSFPVLNEHKKLVAVLTAGFNLQEFSRFLSTLKLPEGSVAVFIDHKGIRLCRLPENEATTIGGPVSPGFFEKVSGGVKEGFFNWVAPDGINRIYAFQQLRLRDNLPPYLYISVGLPQDSIIHAANMIMLRNLSILGITALLSLSLAWFLGNLVLIKPIKRLVTATQQFGRGKMDIRTGLPHTSDELGRLAQSFDDMAALLETRNREREKAEQELTKAYDELEGRVQERTAELSATNIALQAEITERQRTASELKLKERLLDSASDSIFLYDLEGKILYMNEAAYITRWYSKEELLSLGARALTTPAAAVYQESIFRELWGNGELIFESEHRRKDGSVMPVEIFARVLAVEGRELILSEVRDITDRHQAEDKLKRAYEYLENIFANSVDGIGIVDEHGNFQNWNKAAEETYGYTFEELRGKPAATLYAYQSELERMLTQLHREGSVNNYEINMTKKDGSIFPASLSIGLLHSDNKVIGSVAVGRDLTEIHNHVNKLHVANEKLQILVTETEQRSREVTLINAMVEALQSCLSADEAYPIIVDCAQQIFALRSGALFMLRPDSNLLEAVTHWGDTPAGEEVFTLDDCWAIRRGRVHVSEGSSQKQGRCRHLPDKAPGCYLCIPLTAQGETVGLLLMQTADQVDASVIDRLKHVAVSIGDNISLALANIKLRETLRHQVMHDPLTGLFNRRYMDETFKREIARVHRKKAPLGVIMMDLDHFKLFNDTYGHEAGDSLLESLGKFLGRQVRQEDIPCRYGGEEFVLILPGASLDVTQKRAEEIRQGVSQLQVSHRGKVLKMITLSLGVATFPEHGDNEDDLLRAADNAMYQAKAAGRNRVMVAGSNREPGDM
jgi:diguanylate cyclase (GGDEF)-like protein/PAS domain S-box-containing protein